MKAEDYIRAREQENKRLFDIEMLNIGEVYKAIKMARNEERKKAIITARTIIHPMSENGEQENRIVNDFKELLTK